MTFNPAAIRRQFPLLTSGSFAYLDSAASAQKPQAVLDAMDRFYREDNANVHRGMHVLAEQATTAYEDARSTVSRFIGADAHEIIFTKNCTEAINLVAGSWGKANLKTGDSVALSILEHHSNIVPWLQRKEESGVEVLWFDIHDDGTVNMEELRSLLARGHVKLVAITGLSNVLGTKPSLQEMIALAHAAGAKVLVDAAQLIAHERIDVRALDCDFLAFSGHKLYGPTGIGVLYGKQQLLNDMPPFLGGGMMIGTVHKDRFTCAQPPAKFEAGTPPIAEAVGLAAAIDWLSQFDWEEISRHEASLMHHAIDELTTIEGLRILAYLPAGQAGPLSTIHYPLRSGCLSFTIEGIHPHDLTDIIGTQGICLRAGHHCTQPLHKRLGVGASTRLSVGIYNMDEDIDRTVEAIRKAQRTLRPHL